MRWMQVLDLDRFGIDTHPCGAGSVVMTTVGFVSLCRSQDVDEEAVLGVGR